MENQADLSPATSVRRKLMFSNSPQSFQDNAMFFESLKSQQKRKHMDQVQHAKKTRSDFCQQ